MLIPIVKERRYTYRRVRAPCQATRWSANASILGTDTSTTASEPRAFALDGSNAGSWICLTVDPARRPYSAVNGTYRIS